MIQSRVLQTATHFLSPIILTVSLLVLFRGHNYPGGGFIGGLFASAAMTLYLLSHDVAYQKVIRRCLITSMLGLSCLLLSMFLGPLQQYPLLSAVWLKNALLTNSGIKVGSPYLFDIGIYFTVIGGVLLIIQTLESEERD